MTHRTPRAPRPQRFFQRSVLRVATISVAASLGGTPATGLFGFNSALAQNSRAARGAAPPSVGAREPVTLNFANADIEAVARTMSTITGRNVVVDPRVKGTMTLVTERPVPPAVAFNQFLAALRLQSFTVVESAGLYKVVPEADGKLQGGAVTVAPATGGAAGNQIVTQIFKLNFENANNLVPVLRPLISPNNTINVNPGNNSLVITDYAENLQRIGKIIATMDVSNASDVEVIPLRHAVATDLAPLVSRLIDGSGSAPVAGGLPGAQPTGVPGGQGQTDNAFRTTLIAEPRSNALILRAANPARVSLVRSLVARLDQPTQDGANGDAGNIRVVYLKNAEATRLAVTLRAAMASLAAASGNSGVAGALPGGGTTGVPQQGGMSSSPSGFGGSSGNVGSFGAAGGSNAALGSSASSNFANSAMPSTGGSIQADPATNSLIITASEPLYRQLRAVIDKLDGRRAQVLVESLIVEVNASKVADFGIQWQTALGNSGDGTVGVIGNNSGVAGSNIIGLALAAAGGTTGLASAVTNGTGPSRGFNLALAPRINGRYYLGALANFLQTSGDANVLSTPNLLTLDNEEARIIIGQNVPFPTGSYANSTGSSTVNPFTTVERKDVGLTLRVKPQINENGTVKMAIYQEVSSVDTSTIANQNGPTTNKRSIESNVLVDDGSIVVLGGLLQDDYSLSQDKIPVLGDVPLVGGLFRNENRSRRKTNLMVFLRPVVVRDAAESDSLTQDRYEAIRALQQNIQPAPSTVMNGVSGAPVLPPMPAPTPRKDAGGGIQGTTLVPPPLPPTVTRPSGPPLRGALPATADPATRQESP
ncbi:type II secretion system secretin GspD [Xylophilus ampelinus]|uniref:General secretion pathway protein D n=1 Tax=Xylophilus ampelinus TaxID=54067 RepID=A0A318SFH0_9BURK|nr:type II secretion system secretin GspD [Xylophilus ampelinus]MCS4511018.1 type II secretion system secretin GspD [Xylophilus ampelinus]PYE75988.1 general secretion pathway protein D [Xylophilus ampelinus]